MKYAHAAAAKAARITKAGVTALDAKFQAIPLPSPAPASASPGQLAAAMAANASTSTTAVAMEVKTIREGFNHAHGKAVAEIEAARQHGSDLAELAAHLETGSPITSTTVDPVLKAAALAARKGILAGVVDPLTAEEMQRNILGGLSVVDEARADLKRLQSVGRVALANNLKRLYQRCAENAGFSKSQRARFANLAEKAARLHGARLAEHRALHQGGRS